MGGNPAAGSSSSGATDNSASGSAFQDWDVRPAQLLDGGTLRQAVAGRDDEVGLQLDDLLDIDAGEGGDDGDRRRLGWEVGDVLDLGDDPRTGAEREQDLGRSGRQGHDLPGLRRDGDLRALVIGEGHGERGRQGGRCRRKRGWRAGRWRAGGCVRLGRGRTAEDEHEGRNQEQRARR
jgi:hypothetical protein